MDFDNVFSTSDMYGMATKQFFLASTKNSLKNMSDDYKVSLLKLQIECLEEILKEIEGDR